MADHDTWPEDPNVTAPKAKSSGGCGKTILVIGGIGFVVMVLCCGVVGFVGYSLMPKMVTAPAEVSELAKQVVDMKIPDSFQPESGMSMQNFAFSMHIVTYKHQDAKGMLMLGDFELKTANANQKPDIAEKMNEGIHLKVGNAEVREFDIRGKKVPFRFADATEKDTDKAFRLVDGSIETPKGEIFIKLVVEPDAYDEDQVVEMIESIH